MSEETTPTQQPATPVGPAAPCYALGEAVYYNESKEIGIITDKALRGGQWEYRINYCQGKDLTGPRGGNGPVWREGYPQPVTDPSDILYVKALQLTMRSRTLKRELESIESDIAAVVRARTLLHNAQE